MKNKILKSFLCLLILFTTFYTFSIKAQEDIDATVFLQGGGETWANYPYGYEDSAATDPGTISSSGCGLLALVNSVYYLTNNFIDPTWLADYSVSVGSRINGNGTAASLFKKFCDEHGEKYNVSYAGTVSSYAALNNYLNNGYAAIVGGCGHYISLVAFDAETDSYYVLDSAPNSQSYGANGRAQQWRTQTNLKNCKGTENSGWLGPFYLIKKELVNKDDCYPFNINGYYYSDVYLSNGSKGNDVYWLQSALNKLGANLTIDGSYGNNTKNAVINFQTDNGLSNTGTLTEETRDKLIEKLIKGIGKLVITFEIGENIEPIKKFVNAGENIPFPQDPISDDYRFEGWLYNGDYFDFDNELILENMTFTAKWGNSPIKVGNRYYLEWQEALTSAKDNESIVLFDDITFSASGDERYYNNPTTLSIDLGGHTLYNDLDTVIMLGGASNITISNGTLKAKSNSVVQAYNRGNLTLNNVELISESNEYIASVGKANAVISFNNCTLKTTGINEIVLETISTGTINVDNNTMQSLLSDGLDYSYYISGGGLLNIYANVTIEYGNTKDEKLVLLGTKISKPIDPILEDKVFMGWYCNNIEFDFNQEINENIQIKGKFIEPIIIEVELNCNEGICEISSKEYVIGEVLGSLPVPEKTGYFFSSWYADKDYVTRVTTDTIYDGTYSTLYAKWKPVEYIISYDSTLGTIEVNRQIKLYDIDLKVNNEIPICKKYVFKGWSLSQDNNIVSYKTDDTIKENKNITLYAVWEKAMVVNVEVFNAPDKVNYEVGEVIDLTGLNIKLTYEDGTIEIIEDGFTTDTTLSESGNKTIVVMNGDITFDLAINVNETENGCNSSLISLFEMLTLLIPLMFVTLITKRKRLI